MSISSVTSSLKRLDVVFRLTLSIVTVALFVIAAVYLVLGIIDGERIFLSLVLLWAIMGYFILPSAYRFISRIYLPTYYIGRTKSAHGFYSDPVNIAFIGSENNLHKAMRKAGWHRADELNAKTAIKIFYMGGRNKSYETAPVTPLYLFDRQQDFAYQQQMNGNPRERHHVRFWKTPDNWYLPGGYKADWLAASTYDKHVGISLYTGQIVHKISSDTDKERDYILKSIRKTKHVVDIKVVKHFNIPFVHRNGDGDKISTDGSLPFVKLK